MIYLINDPQGRTDSAADAPHSHLHPRTGVRPDAPYAGDRLPVPTDPPFYRLQLLALGHPYAVDNCCKRLHKLRYAQIGDWSIPLPIIRSTEVIRAAAPGDVMRILTKRITPPA